MARWGLALYLAVLAALGLWLTAVDEPVRDQVEDLVEWLKAHGAPESFRYGYVEAGANFLLFVPLGILVALLLRPAWWWAAGLVGLVISAGIELAQLVFLSSRTPDEIDLFMNAAGAFAGAAVGWLIHLVRRRRRDRGVAVG